MPTHYRVPEPGPDGVVRLRKEMSITRDEFVRMLDVAIRPATYTVDGDRIEVSGAPGAVTITLSGDRERRIALLRLPVVDVDIALSEFPADAIEPFLVQFDRAYQRGGG